MATLINYDYSTFKLPKPNKRRLQELQHSEARAHAARVAYWRTRKSPSSAVAKGASSGHVQNEDPVNALPTPSTSSRETSVESGRHVKLSRPDKKKYEPSDSTTKNSNHAQGATPQPLHTGNGHSAALTISSNRSPQSNSSPWSLNQNGGSFISLTEVGHKWIDVADYTRLVRHPSSDLFDPLDTLPTRQGEEVVASMNHFLHSWAPSQRPGLKYQTKDNPLIKDIFNSALQHRELFEALVSLCLTFQAAGQDFKTPLREAGLYHKGQALMGIRTKLTSGSVDEAIILSTVFLMITDNVFLDEQAYKTHLKGLRQMVTGKPVYDGIAYSGALQSFVAWAESNALLLFGNDIASDQQEPHEFVLDYPVKPFPKVVTRMISGLTPGFRSIAVDARFCTQVLSVLLNTTRWIFCIDETSRVKTDEFKETFLLSFDPRSNSAEAMRLCRASNLTLERTICKALYILHANILAWSCRCSGYRHVLEELSETLCSDELSQRGYGEVWSWLAMVTANGARRAAMGRIQEEVMSKFQDVNEGRDWASIICTMRFFLSHSTFEREWERCWETGVKH
ncbi:hypothetical protein LTR10_015452 [Elasticomyces elasticus]|uniref:Tachykinin family protein n=1 Tax=Exophiala sideris TaxID=1016849 RepID=A0ABR0J4I1_9EURO|nr:hypothetical protein LTR10_015452 [Elasticomyces elasticus]KAK5026957.1 hypothetical protein LTS07_007256 [Exophiala sideris]KAK5033961.1 hypothetical protein LTR13_006561 [Exophiala sideris]KAK5055765.1 hypothetical protein LTR69_008140 [Exophiala sideris]KAK5180903.1 hypothetical protein LTR44_006723 [Eurotiomycetes sp. CCFEE 6388]